MHKLTNTYMYLPNRWPNIQRTPSKNTYEFWLFSRIFFQFTFISCVTDSLERRDKMKPSVMITSPGSPDINAVCRSRTSARTMQGANSSIGGRIQVIAFDPTLRVHAGWSGYEINFT